eukprot:scaffold80879_cov58-Phaeocystis_antarctica.AAC.3
MPPASPHVESTANIWPASAAQAAGWPRLSEVRGSPEHDLALREASGAPACPRRPATPGGDVGGVESCVQSRILRRSEPACADETIYCVRVALGAQPFDSRLRGHSGPQQLDINANGQPMQDTSNRQNYYY